MPRKPIAKSPPRLPRSARETSARDSARLEALFASIGEGVIATDEAGTVTRVNQVALDLLGMRRSDVLHKRFLSVVVAVHDNGTALDVFERPIVRAFQTGKTVSARMLYQQKNGSLLPVQVNVSPIVLRGRPIGAIEVFRDLTAEIENDKLKSDFISIASHQLRTPLSAINMYTRMLHDGMAGELRPEQLPYIDIVLASVKRMNTLINTLLNITRIEAGGILIKKDLLQLDSLTQEVMTEFIPAAQAKSITLTAKLPPRMKPTYADNLLIKEICGNLLSNAIKYTPDGGRVTLQLSETPKEVQWTVSDNGYGIPAHNQKNIFLKFYRAENIVGKDVSGTGLGLYLIKNIAESLGGELWFESTENVGSVFHFALPKDKPAQPARSSK
ncbi:MAG TPA: ATP-binding protein [Candidatus Saccharimonadales bacterium]|nr:ATP-binding protein [Candidatus Saccharimonadales bacterium]